MLLTGAGSEKLIVFYGIIPCGHDPWKGRASPLKNPAAHCVRGWRFFEDDDIYGIIPDGHDP
jgi:hypothetical protein